MNYRLIKIDHAVAQHIISLSGMESYERCGNPNVEIHGDPYFSRLTSAAPGSITFAYAKRGSDPKIVAELIDASEASMILVDPALKPLVSDRDDRIIVFVPDTRIAFIELIEHHLEYYLPVKKDPKSISSTCYIGENVWIEDSVEIGDHTTIHGNNHISGQVSIGRNVEILPGVVIGGEGFGFARTQDGNLVNFPHLGGVTIEDNVYIGANTTIDRGQFGNTHLKQGCKIDNLAYIAHNACIGQDTLICSHTTILGSVEVGSNVRVAPSATIRDGCSVGDYALIGMAACVTKDIPAGKVAYGVPARITGDRLT